MKTGYECSECGAVVDVDGINILRSCIHTSKVVMSIGTTIHAGGQLKTESPFDKMVSNLASKLKQIFENDKKSG
jgi:hypothetical protein